MTNTTANNLEAQIAKALASGTAAEIGGLIAAAERAARQAEEEAAKARARALDPATSGPALAEARRAMEEAKFTAERMAAAAVTLREAHSAAQEAEEDRRRRTGYDAALEARNAAAEALAANYTRLADELAGLLEAAAKADAMAEKANACLPRGAVQIPTVDAARPGFTPLTKPLRTMTLLAWHAHSLPFWGRPERLGAGETWRRTRPAALEAEGNPEEAA